MLKSSIKQMTMSGVCIVMCLIVTTALANDLPFSDESYFMSAHNAGNNVEKRYASHYCSDNITEAESVEACTFTVNPNDLCTQTTVCSRSSGDQWNEEDLCKAAKWAIAKTFMSGRQITMIQHDGRVNSRVVAYGNDPNESCSAIFYNNEFAHAYNEVIHFLRYQDLTMKSFYIDVYVFNCSHFAWRGLQD